MSAPSKPVPIIIDTDIGDDVDDAYCLVLAARWPEVELVAVTPCYLGTLLRAKLCRKLLDIAGAPHVPVFSANREVHRAPQLTWAEDVDWEPPEETAPEALVRLASERPGELTLVTIGPLTNIKHAAEIDPHFGRKYKRIIAVMGALGEDPANPPHEYNARCDPEGARALFDLGADLVVANVDVTSRARLTEPWMSRLRAVGQPWTDALVKLTELWGGQVPILFDPMGLSCVVNRFCQFQPMRLKIDDEGRTVRVDGEPNCLMAVDGDVPGFLDWYVETVSK